MKILFIGSPEFDYLQDLTYSGLTKILGSNVLVENKINMRYHLPFKKYPKSLGYNGFGLGFLNRTTHYRDYDYVIVAAAKPDCFLQYKAVLPFLKASVKTVFIDGGDWPAIGGDLDRLKNDHLYHEVVNQRPFDIIFKREYFKEQEYANNIYPLQFSFNMNKIRHIKSLPFKYDVSFWAVESDPIRTKALTLLDGQFDTRENGTVKSQVFRKYKRKGSFYFEEMKRCKVLLNFRGVGWDTLRYWEIPALARFMISQPVNLVIPHDFIEGEEIIYCQKDLSDLIDLCKYFLKHDNEREKIAGNAFKKFSQFHTDEAKAKYIMDTIAKA